MYSSISVLDNCPLPKNRKLGKHCPKCDIEIDDRATTCRACNKSGEDNPCYRHGLSKMQASPERSITIEYAEWMKSVFARDNWKCQHCGSDAKLRAHHIYSYAKYSELRLNVANGITLCEYHHKQLHQLFGLNVKPKQLKWYFANVK